MLSHGKFLPLPAASSHPAVLAPESPESLDGKYSIRQIVEAAVALERERCLKIAIDLIIEENFEMDCGVLTELAKRIGATC